MASYVNGNLAYRQNEIDSYYKLKSRNQSKKSIPIKEKLFYLFSVLFIVTLASLVISGYAQKTEYNYSIQKLENSIKELNETNDQLQIKIAELSSPDRIIKIAQNELGMSLDEQQVIILSQSLN